MKKLAIYGAGGLGREVALMINQINQVHQQWDLIGFFDDGRRKDDYIDYLVVLGGINEVNALESSCAIVIAIADAASRKSIVERIENNLIYYPIIIHPKALLGSAKNQWGEGTIIAAGCLFTTGIIIGKFTIVNLACTLGHDVRLGDFCSVMPGCNISGNVVIGEATLIGTGTQVLQNITIGAQCTIGAGAVVINNIESGLTVVGIPANRLIG